MRTSDTAKAGPGTRKYPVKSAKSGKEAVHPPGTLKKDAQTVCLNDETGGCQ